MKSAVALTVVVRDQGNALPGIHQQQTAAGHISPW
jgi:hypothetical protein